MAGFEELNAPQLRCETAELDAAGFDLPPAPPPRSRLQMERSTCSSLDREYFGRLGGGTQSDSEPLSVSLCVPGL